MTRVIANLPRQLLGLQLYSYLIGGSLRRSVVELNDDGGLLRIGRVVGLLRRNGQIPEPLLDRLLPLSIISRLDLRQRPRIPSRRQNLLYQMLILLQLRLWRGIQY